MNLKIGQSDIKEEQNVLFIQKKKRAQRFNVKRRILKGKLNLTFYSTKKEKEKGAQHFF